MVDMTSFEAVLWAACDDREARKALLDMIEEDGVELDPFQRRVINLGPPTRLTRPSWRDVVRAWAGRTEE